MKILDASLVTAVKPENPALNQDEELQKSVAQILGFLKLEGPINELLKNLSEALLIASDFSSRTSGTTQEPPLTLTLMQMALPKLRREILEIQNELKRQNIDLNLLKQKASNAEEEKLTKSTNTINPKLLEEITYPKDYAGTIFKDPQIANDVYITKIYKGVYPSQVIGLEQSDVQLQDYEGPFNRKENEIDIVELPLNKIANHGQASCKLPTALGYSCSAFAIFDRNGNKLSQSGVLAKKNSLGLTTLKNLPCNAYSISYRLSNFEPSFEQSLGSSPHCYYYRDSDDAYNDLIRKADTIENKLALLGEKIRSWQPVYSKAPGIGMILEAASAKGIFYDVMSALGMIGKCDQCAEFLANELALLQIHAVNISGPVLVEDQGETKFEWTVPHAKTLAYNKETKSYGTVEATAFAGPNLNLNKKLLDSELNEVLEKINEFNRDRFSYAELKKLCDFIQEKARSWRLVEANPYMAEASWLSGNSDFDDSLDLLNQACYQSEKEIEDNPEDLTKLEWHDYRIKSAITILERPITINGEEKTELSKYLYKIFLGGSTFNEKLTRVFSNIAWVDGLNNKEIEIIENLLELAGLLQKFFDKESIDNLIADDEIFKSILANPHIKRIFPADIFLESVLDKIKLDIENKKITPKEALDSIQNFLNDDCVNSLIKRFSESKVDRRFYLDLMKELASRILNTSTSSQGKIKLLEHIIKLDCFELTAASLEDENEMQKFINLLEESIRLQESFIKVFLDSNIIYGLELLAENQTISKAFNIKKNPNGKFALPKWLIEHILEINKVQVITPENPLPILLKENRKELISAFWIAHHIDFGRVFSQGSLDNFTPEEQATIKQNFQEEIKQRYYGGTLGKLSDEDLALIKYKFPKYLESLRNENKRETWLGEGEFFLDKCFDLIPGAGALFADAVKTAIAEGADFLPRESLGDKNFDTGLIFSLALRKNPDAFKKLESFCLKENYKPEEKFFDPFFKAVEALYQNEAGYPYIKEAWSKLNAKTKEVIILSVIYFKTAGDYSPLSELQQSFSEQDPIKRILLLRQSFYKPGGLGLKPDSDPQIKAAIIEALNKSQGDFETFISCLELPTNIYAQKEGTNLFQKIIETRNPYLWTDILQKYLLFDLNLENIYRGYGFLNSLMPILIEAKRFEKSLRQGSLRFADVSGRSVIATRFSTVRQSPKNGEEDFKEFRELAPGEAINPNQISWKQTGKNANGAVIVRVNESLEENKDKVFLVDMDWLADDDCGDDFSQNVQDLIKILNIELKSRAKRNLDLIFVYKGQKIASYKLEELRDIFFDKRDIQDELPPRSKLSDFIVQLATMVDRFRCISYYIFDNFQSLEEVVPIVIEGKTISFKPSKVYILSTDMQRRKNSESFFRELSAQGHSVHLLKPQQTH